MVLYLESLGAPLPGESALVASAFLASTGERGYGEAPSRRQALDRLIERWQELREAAKVKLAPTKRTV